MKKMNGQMRKYLLTAVLMSALMCLAAVSACAGTKVADANGNQGDLDNYINRNALVVFAEKGNSNCEYFYRAVQPSLPMLQQYGIGIVVVLTDAEDNEETAALSRKYPGIVFLRALEATQESRWYRYVSVPDMWQKPEIFIRSAAGQILGFSCTRLEPYQMDVGTMLMERMDDPADTAAKAVQLLTGNTVEPAYLKYKVTVNLLLVDNALPLAAPIVREYGEKENYEIEVPEIAGYTAQSWNLFGTMANEDVEETFWYEKTVNPLPAEYEFYLVTDKDTVCLNETFNFRYYTKYLPRDTEKDSQYYVYAYRGYNRETKNFNMFDRWPGGDSFTLEDNTYDRIVVEVTAKANGITRKASAEVKVDKDRVYDPDEKIKSFVKRCYKLILNREADEGGLQGWCEALKNKTAAAAQIIDGFVKSDEFTNRKFSNGAKVDILYKAMLNREADAGGKAGWVDAMSKGYTLQHIIAGFCGSDEFAAVCRDYDIKPGTVLAAPVNPEPAPDTPRGKIEAFVKRCYKLILNRDADEGGLKGWSDALETGVGQACQIIDGFVRSPEYVNRNLGHAESVDILYQTMLNRAADAGGKAGWVDALEKGYTLQHIINGFCGSAEFTNICNEFGITAGNLLVQGVLVKREAIAPEGEEEAPVVYVNYTSEYTDEEKIRSFVEHCYEAVFGREGDAEGVEAWTKLILDGKKTPKRVAYEFIFSDEFQSNLPGNEDFIRILYKLYLDREPGADELTGWTAMLENGTGLEEIVNSFAASEEFRTILQRMK